MILFVLFGAFGLVLMFAGITGSPSPPVRKPRRLDSLIRDAGLQHMSGRGLVALVGGAWLVIGVVVAGLTSSLIVAVSIASIGAWLPVAWLRARAVRLRRSYAEAWPDAIASLIAAVRAGVSLPEACIGLTARGPAELAPGFAALAATYRATGSFEAGLARLRTQLSDPIADRVAVALTVTHEVGGSDLVRVLRSLGDFVREDLRIRREIEARWSWTVTAARVAAGAPWAVLLMMTSQPEAAAAYETPTGVGVICGGALASMVGYRLMLRAARLPDDPRLPS